MTGRILKSLNSLIRLYLVLNLNDGPEADVKSFFAGGAAFIDMVWFDKINRHR